jgi:hypothetical protein
VALGIGGGHRTAPGSPSPGVERASIFAVLTPHRVRDERALRSLFERRMLELHVGLDQAAVFRGLHPLAPLRIDRWSRGLLGVMRADLRDVPVHQPP